MPRLRQSDLHKAFISALDGSVISHGDVNTKPLEMDLRPPLPTKVRLYLYTITHPPGGRTKNEHKIQLKYPGMSPGRPGSFDRSGGKMVTLCGLEPDLNIFVLWDADMYPSFTYSRNLQVKADTVYAALSGDIGTQIRKIKGQDEETVFTANATHLAEAIRLRADMDIKRLLEG